ncbi:MAG: HPr family phosphocarrier protein [Oscillospiraceae bacterium]|nr:HPr family phosphocarrier protein [Ruminococcus sp.]MCD8345863.1 HPr family phosphocarrier protein [Oscillospiraceae bacterium]
MIESFTYKITGKADNTALALLAHEAAKYSCYIIVAKPSSSPKDAKSIMSLITGCFKTGDTVEFSFDGSDADVAAKNIKAAIDSIGL